MILIDANLLLYARVAIYPEHGRAREWLDDQLNGPTPVGIPWQSLTAFFRIAINPRVFARPLAYADAWKQVEDWLACGPVWTPVPTDRHARIFGQIVSQTPITPNLVADAHLAALALEHGLAMCSADGDFARFAGLRWINPVAPA